MRAWPDGTPNPGSDAANAQGCRCPRMDNRWGKSAPWPPDGWYVSGDCPVHHVPARDVEEADSSSVSPDSPFGT